MRRGQTIGRRARSGLALAVAFAAAVGASGVARASSTTGQPHFVSLPGSGASQLGTGRLYAAAAALPGGAILIAGGVSSSNSVLGSAAMFEPGAETFTTLTNRLQVARASAVAAPLPNGDVLIAGGQTSDFEVTASAELFDPTTRRFTALKSTLNIARYGAVAATLRNGEVLIAGGGTNNPTQVLSSAELFNPGTDRFSLLKSHLQTARASAVAARLPNGKILIAGGDAGGTLLGKPIASAELFDPATDRFSALKAQLRIPGWGAAAAPLSNGDVLIVGGVDRHNNVTSDAELFDPAGSTFTALPHGLQTARDFAVAAPLPGGKALVVGGQDANGHPLRSAELLVP